MVYKTAIQISALTLVSTAAFAQTQTTPPPWFNDTKIEEQTESALPKVEETFKITEELNKPASRLEEHYRERTENKVLTQFGYDLFQTEISDENDLPSGAVQDNYVLGTGDELIITFTGQRNDQVKTKITPQGQILIKDLPPIPAAGLTIADLRKALQKQTEKIPNTQSYVSLSKIKQIGVLVVGHAKNPGKKNLNAFHTVLDAIRIAGGVQKNGSLRQIKLVRGGISQRIDLYQLFLDGSVLQDMNLKNGDRIIIPPIGATIAVTGAVKRPGIYELKTKKSIINLSKALKYGGETLSPGNNRYIKLSPSKSGSENISEISNLTIPQFSNGMILDVQRGTDEKQGGILLNGHTNKPGLYDTQKHPFLYDVLSKESVLGPDTYPLLGLIKRKDKTLLTTQIISFSPQIVLDKKNNQKLQNNDEIILLSNKEIKGILSEENSGSNSFENIQEKDKKEAEITPKIKSFIKEHSIAIRGAVRIEGQYPATRNTPLNALLSAAGGTTRIANLSNIETTKTNSENNKVTRTTLDINPDSFDFTEPSNLLFSPGDTIRVNQQHKAVKNNVVTIVGEVLNPGEYDLLPGDNVSSLIQRVGGLTEQAYPMGAIFSRESARRTEELRYRNTARDLERRLAAAIEKDGKNTPNETQIEMVRDLSAQLSSIKAIGRITVELDPDILEVRPELDMLLENGDKIYIPKRPLTVRVAGEVFSPAVLQFNSEKDPRDYIHEAGGFTKAADKNRTFVIFPNGSAQPLKVNSWNHNPIMIPPGSTIVVPLDPKPFNFLTSAKEIGQIIGNLAVTAIFIDDIRD